MKDELTDTERAIAYEYGAEHLENKTWNKAIDAVLKLMRLRDIMAMEMVAHEERQLMIKEVERLKRA